MFNPRKILSRIWFPFLLLSALALVVACGSSATEAPPTATSAPQATVAPTAMAEQPTAMAGQPTAMAGQPTAMAEQPTVAPTSTPRPAPTKVLETTHTPEGVINYGVKETGIFEGHPLFVSSPRIQFSSLTFGEGLVAIQEDLSPGPLLAESWDISDDFLTWTWRLRDDVEFHKGYGNMTAEDVLYTYRSFFEGAKHARAGIMGDYWSPDRGATQTMVDSHTIEVTLPEPKLQQTVFEYLRHLGGSSSWVVSKKQSDEMTPKAASKDIAATGPWEIESHDPGGTVWRFNAVQDHWRQTPYFATLNVRSIPEEAARVAGFQTGKLDTIDMAFDSLEAVKAVEGTIIVNWPYAGQAGLNIYGQTYGVDKDGNPYEYTDCTNPWVSCNEDPTSEEWLNAVKVKRALAVAIDRQSIVDELLSGFGSPLSMRDWMGHDAKADPRWTFDYDPDLARQLIAEAGFPDGFSITLTPAIRGAPAEVEACEAVAQYWEAVDVEVKLQNTPYATIRPELITRKYQGATCHTVSQRLTPAIGASNYVAKSTFSYGTEHPWMEENITDLLGETNPALVNDKEVKVYGWLYDNVMAFALYAHDGVWPVGERLDPEWTPLDFSEVRLPQSFEYIKHRQ